MKSLAMEGKVQGRAIELNTDPGLPDGQDVRDQLLVPDMIRWPNASGRWQSEESIDAAPLQIDHDRHSTKNPFLAAIAGHRVGNSPDRLGHCCRCCATTRVMKPK